MRVKKILILSFLISLLIITGCGDSELETEKTASFSINTEVEEGGEIRLEPKQDNYDYQDKVKIEAIADEDWQFKEWSCGLSETERMQKILIEGDKNIIAEFEIADDDDNDNDDDDDDNDNDNDDDDNDNDNDEDDDNDDEDNDDDDNNDDNDKEEFSLEIETAKGGEVKISPEQDRYKTGEKVEIEAIADKNWEFSHWREAGNNGSNKNPWEIEMKSNREIKPVFTKEEHTVTFKDYAGEILEEKQVEHGSSAQAPSEPKRKGHEFIGWDKQDFKEVKKDLIVTAEYKAHITGEGTEDNPYQVKTFTGLEKIEQENYSLDKHYQLVTDIDASITQEDDYNDGQGWKPIGEEDNIFAGSFDGQNHEISGLYINRSEEDYVGFLRETGSDSELKNIVITDITIKGENNIGALVGSNSSNIANADVSGKISGEFRIGGVTGFSSSQIKDSSFVGNIEGVSNIGGLVGKGSPGERIKSSYAKGEIIGDENIGGLLGLGDSYKLSSFAIKDSYAEVDIKGDENIGGLNGRSSCIEIYDSNATGNIQGNKLVGGLIGSNSSGFRGTGASINNSYATGDVEGKSKIGGLVGSNDGDLSGATISESYAKGDVTGVDKIGGLVGYSDGLIEASYSKSDVEGENKVGGLIGENNCDDGQGHKIRESYAIGNISGVEKIGGLVGYNDGPIEDSYSKADVEGKIEVGGLIGKNSSSVEIKNTYSMGEVIGDDDVGGLIGYIVGGAGAADNSYWDRETSGQEGSHSGDGKDTAEMQNESTYQDWDFDDLWEIDEGNTYPYLQ